MIRCSPEWAATRMPCQHGNDPASMASHTHCAILLYQMVSSMHCGLAGSHCVEVAILFSKWCPSCGKNAGMQFWCDPSPTTA